jgi:thioredoxin reductase (NADPH)
LNIPGEEHFKGTGISYCATCDGEFFTDKELIVVGGGNSALEEAVTLTNFATKVTIVHQFDQFQALNTQYKRQKTIRR